VASAIADPEDVLIVEGFPQLDPETSSIAVFATNTTTKKLQGAQRQAQVSGKSEALSPRLSHQQMES
jgi:molybdopterin-guanine dinucleotide biosynthesis protein